MKRRILQFPLAAAKGGVTQYVLNLWKNIDRSVIQFDFVTFSRELDFEEELLREGCRVYHMSCYPEADEEQFRREFGEVLDYGYDAIELHTSYWKNTIMEEMARRYGIQKIILHAHSTGIAASLSDQQMDAAKKLHYKIRDGVNDDLADRFLACSWEAADWLYGSQIPRNQISIITNTIDTEKYKFNKERREQKRSELNLTDKYVIGHVGRLEKEKNHKFIVDIFSQVHARIPQAVLILVGDGSCKKEIEEQIAYLKIEKCVILAGKRDDISDYLQVMDFFVFPSLFEGFGLALLEAQCCGLYCIGSTNVPSDAFVTRYARQISLKKPESWIYAIEEAAKGYIRESQHAVLKKKGYDVSDQIKLLEKIYME